MKLLSLFFLAIFASFSFGLVDDQNGSAIPSGSRAASGNASAETGVADVDGSEDSETTDEAIKEPADDNPPG